MNYKKTYAVLGLGRYGLSVAKELERNGADVIAVDRDEKIINSNAKELFKTTIFYQCNCNKRK